MAVEIITREDLNEFRSLLLTDLKEYDYPQFVPFALLSYI